MFHYVMSGFNYYHFDIELFEKIIKYLNEKYKIISLKEYNNLINKKKEIDDNYIMLTFDDGTIDHYKYVYPILKKYNCSGLFFVSSNIFYKKVLDIQIIHQLFAKIEISKLYHEVIDEIKSLHTSIKINKYLFLKSEQEKFIKENLQYILPKPIRTKIIQNLSKKYKISTNFKDYYMNIENMKEMKKNNMFFGLHTSNHKRLSMLSYDEQYNEIMDNLISLKKYNLLDNEFISIAYPFGEYDNNTLKILNNLDIKYGFKVGKSDNNNLLEIAREDCNILKEDEYAKLH